MSNDKVFYAIRCIDVNGEKYWWDDDDECWLEVKYDDDISMRTTGSTADELTKAWHRASAGNCILSTDVVKIVKIVKKEKKLPHLVPDTLKRPAEVDDFIDMINDSRSSHSMSRAVVSYVVNLEKVCNQRRR